MLLGLRKPNTKIIFVENNGKHCLMAPGVWVLIDQQKLTWCRFTILARWRCRVKIRSNCFLPVHWKKIMICCAMRNSDTTPVFRANGCVYFKFKILARCSCQVKVWSNSFLLIHWKRIMICGAKFLRNIDTKPIFRANECDLFHI